MQPEIVILLLSLAGLPSLAMADCGTGELAPCPDRDHDGVVDAADQCDSEPGAPVTINGCAHDTDGDGMPDYRDNCPDLAAAAVDAWGCPVATEVTLPEISFEVNSVRLKKSSHASLDDAAELLLLYDNLQAEIAGHTDDTGSAEHNRQISRLRAEAVRRYLIKAGVDANRISARGYGESRPIASNETEQDRSRNRRVVLRIIAGELRVSEN